MFEGFLEHTQKVSLHVLDIEDGDQGFPVSVLDETITSDILQLVRRVSYLLSTDRTTELWTQCAILVIQEIKQKRELIAAKFWAVRWLQQPITSHQLELVGLETKQYPHRIDVYSDPKVARAILHVRYFLQRLLRLLKRIGVALMESSLLQEHQRGLVSRDLLHVDEEELRCADDVCAAVPFLMGYCTKDTRIGDLKGRYPHAPFENHVRQDFGGEMMNAGMEMKHILSLVPRDGIVPSSQQQWIQQYMTVFSMQPLDGMRTRYAES